MKVDRRSISPSSGRTQETFDTYGHNVHGDDYGMGTFSKSGKYTPAPEPVPHEDIDTDELRKRNNERRNSSYRK